MKIAFRPVGRIAPSGEADTQLVGRIAGRHPFDFGDAQMVEKSFQLGCRTLAHADDADSRALHQGHFSPAIPQAIVQQAGRDPPGASPAKDDHMGRRGLSHSGRQSQRSISGILARQ